MRETSNLISIETIKAIFKKELGVNLYLSKINSMVYYHSKNLNHSVMPIFDIVRVKCWYVSLEKETKSDVDLELKNHYVKTEKDLLNLIRKFKKVRKMI